MFIAKFDVKKNFMGNAQSLLTLGALTILSFTSLNFNSTILESSTVEIENKVALTAFSLADDLLEEIKVRSFDEKTKQFPTTNINSLTEKTSLGKDVGEVYPNFDDVDDYNGFSKFISAPHAENYSVTCVVNYVKESDPDDVSSMQTFYKKATVMVSSPYLRDPISLSFVFTLK